MPTDTRTEITNIPWNRDHMPPGSERGSLCNWSPGNPKLFAWSPEVEAFLYVKPCKNADAG